MEGNQAQPELEIRVVGERETSAADPPAPPNVLEQARLGNLDLFRTELDSHPLDFKAGRGQYFNRTPLHLAAMGGHEEIVEFILSRPGISGGVVNAKDSFGYTPLHLAVRHSHDIDDQIDNPTHENVVRILTASPLVLPDRFLAATSEPDELGNHFGGYTPLHLAAVRGHIAIAKLLLQQPCQVEFAYDPVNLHAVTWDGKTPLDLAQKRFYPSRNEGIAFHGLGSTFKEARRQKYLTLVRLLSLSDSNWLQQYRERTAMSANAILVGAALVVAASFGSWLQPPGGIPVPDSGAPSPSPSGAPSPSPYGAPSLSPYGPPSPSPSLFGSADKYWNSVFYVCNAFAFTFSVVSLTIGTLATLPGYELSSEDDVMRLRKVVGVAQMCLLAAVLFLLFCFSFAGSIVLRNFAAIYGTSTYYAVTWLPVIAFVYVSYFLGSWGLNMRQDYGMKMRVILVCSALFYGLTFIVPRFVKK